MHQTSSFRDAASVSVAFDYPFRIFFLSVAVLAALIVPLWTMLVTGSLTLPLALPALFWHQHEMLFGMLPAAIAGFLLTAVCVWTGTERTHGRRLALMWGVWLAGRLTMLLGADLPFWLVLAVNLAFLPLVMVDAGWRILRARQLRQAPLLIVLGLLWLTQAAFLLNPGDGYGRIALVAALALSAMIGGRITPAFTTGWLKTQRPGDGMSKSNLTLDRLQLASMLALFLALLMNWQAVTGLLAVLAGVLMLARLIGWKGWLTGREPLLWMLHLALSWIPIALFLLAGARLLGWSESAWLHAAGIGVVASLILGVMARVSLGHTGRPLHLPRGMVAAFVMIQLAAVLRVLAALGIMNWQPGVLLAALLWELAFLIFLARYGGILSRPRADAGM